MAMASEQWAASEAMQADEAAAMLVNMRTAHQRALLDLIKGERRSAATTMLGQVAQGLGQLCEGAPVAAQWQAFAQLAQTLSGAEGKLDAGDAKLLRQVDEALRALALSWPDSLHAPAFPELASRLLEAAGQRDRIRPPARGARAALKPLDPTPKPLDTAPKPLDTAPKPLDPVPKSLDTALKPLDTAPVQPDAEAHEEPPADRFAAQVEEALRNIDECLPSWRRQPQEPEPLQELRQTFRNLKAGAKQASAGDAAELAWAIENLLDRVAERTVAASDALFALVERAALLLSVLQAGIEPDRGRLAALVEDADFLASGGSVEAPQANLPTLFFKEAGGLAQTVAQSIEDWSGNPENSGIAPRLLAALNSLKDGAQRSGLPALSEAAQQFQSLVQELADSDAPPSAIAFQELRVWSDDLAAMLAHLQEAAGIESAPEQPAAERDLLAEAEASSALRAQAEQCLTELADGLRDLAAALEQAPPADGDPTPTSQDAPAEGASAETRAGISQLPALLSQVEQAQQLLAEQARREAQLKEGLKPLTAC